jgi:hypothetical protein
MFTYLRLEPYEGKLSRTVLRRERRGNPPDPANWQQSGKSAWTYAKENGLNPQTFTKWTKAEPEAKTCFVEVPTQITRPAPDMPEILIEKGEVKIHIPLMISRGELRTIMEGLGAAL